MQILAPPRRMVYDKASEHPSRSITESGGASFSWRLSCIWMPKVSKQSSHSITVCLLDHWTMADTQLSHARSISIGYLLQNLIFEALKVRRKGYSMSEWSVLDSLYA